MDGAAERYLDSEIQDLTYYATAYWIWERVCRLLSPPGISLLSTQKADATFPPLPRPDMVKIRKFAIRFSENMKNLV